MNALNTLSLYCGYLSWEDFCRLHPEGDSTYAQTADASFLPLLGVLTDTTVPTIILYARPDDFIVLTCNKAYKSIMPIEETEVRGLSFWNAFFPTTENHNESLLLFEALRKCAQSGKAVTTPLLKYDLLSSITHLSESCWWEIKSHR